MALTVASAIVVRLGLARPSCGRRPQWRLKGLVALAARPRSRSCCRSSSGRRVGFGPADGGYASVFIGWTAFNVLFVVGALFWLENLLATAYPLPQRSRAGRRRPGRRPATRGGPGTTSPTALARPAGARGALLLLGVPRRARRRSRGSCSTSSRCRADERRRLAREPPLVFVVVAAVLYWLGGRRRVSRRRGTSSWGGRSRSRSGSSRSSSRSTRRSTRWPTSCSRPTWRSTSCCSPSHRRSSCSSAPGSGSGGRSRSASGARSRGPSCEPAWRPLRTAAHALAHPLSPGRCST